jgi:hypothetical protein
LLVAALCADGEDVGSQAGKKLLQGLPPTGQQRVRVPALLHPRPVARARDQCIAFDDDDAVEVIGKGTCREQSGDAAAENDCPLAIRLPEIRHLDAFQMEASEARAADHAAQLAVR